MCLSPILVKLPDESPLRSLHPSGFMAVPCGTCLECLQFASDSWAARICETMYAFNGVATFLTLTYREDTVPKSYLCRKFEDSSDCIVAYDRVINKEKEILIDDVDMDEYYVEESFNTLCNRDFQLVMKRFRQWRMKFNHNEPFKFVCAPEYGPRTWRPHYHVLLIGLLPHECRYFINTWRREFGFVNFSVCRSKSGVAKYCAKYASKGSFENPLCSRYDGNQNFHFRRTHIDSEGTLIWDDFHFPIVQERFGVDMALVRRPHKISSIGIGVEYLTKEKIKWHMNINDELFDIMYKQKIDRNGNPKFSATGLPIYEPSESGFTQWIARISRNYGDIYLADDDLPIRSRRYLNDLPPNDERITFFNRVNYEEEKQKDLSQVICSFGADISQVLLKWFNDRGYYKFRSECNSFALSSMETQTVKQSSKAIPLPLFYLHRLLPLYLWRQLSSYKMANAEQVLRDKYRLLSADSPMWSDSQIISRIYEEMRYQTQTRFNYSLQASKRFYQKSKI